MLKIASPQELQAELKSIMAFIHASEKPDRQVVASKLRALADRVAARAPKDPEKLYQEAEAAYKRGRKALTDGDLTAARIQAIRIGEWVLKAKDAGLDPKKYKLALKARDALLGAFHKAWSDLKLPAR